MVIGIGSCRINMPLRCLRICGYNVKTINKRVFTVYQIEDTVKDFISQKSKKGQIDGLETDDFILNEKFIIEVSSIKIDIKNKEVLDRVRFEEKIKTISDILCTPIVFISHIICHPIAVSERRLILRDYLADISIKLGHTFFDPSAIIDLTMIKDRDHYNDVGVFTVALNLVKYI